VSGFAGGFEGSEFEDAPHLGGPGGPGGRGGPGGSNGRLVDVDLSVREAEAVVAHLRGERTLTVAESLAVAAVVARLKRHIEE
jgi:hypothetical protein